MHQNAANRLLALVALLLAFPAAAAVRGTVIDSDGKPLAGARVSLYAFESNESGMARLLSAQPEQVPIASTQADAKGNFSLESPKLPAELRVFARGFAPASQSVEPDDDLGAVVLSRAEMRGGTVTAAGKPVAGAVVAIQYAAEYVTRTDEGGRYEAPDPKFAWSITVTHPEFAVERDLALARSTSSAVKLQRSLSRGSERNGRVVAGDGQTPVAGAAIVVDGIPLATSGEDGAFTISHMPAKWSMLEARKESWIGQRAFTAAGPLNVTMAKAARITGRLYDRKSRMPLAGAVVSLGGRRPAIAAEGPSTLTDAKGIYSLLTVPGSWNLVTSLPGYAFAQADVSATAGQTATRDLALDQLARVSGTVLDEEKRAVAAAMIRPEATGPMSGPMRMLRSSAATAPDGRFVIRLTTEQELKLRATRKGLPPGSSDTLRLAPGERKGGVSITLPSGVEVTGRVTDRNGDPLANALVSTSESEDGGPMFMRRIGRGGAASEEEELVRSGKDGSWSLRVKEGKYDFAFRLEGYAPRLVRGQTVAVSGSEPVNVTLEPAVEVSGRVVRGGTGIEGVNLFAFADMSDATTTTGPDGSFTLTGLSPGQLRVMLRKEDDLVQEQRTVTAPARDVIFDIPPGTRVSGRVVEKGTKRPVTSFQAGVSVSRSSGAMVFMAPPLLRSFTSDDGSFVLDNVPLGSVNLVAQAPGFANGKVTLTLEEGKPAEGIEIELDTGVRLAGRVTSPGGAAVADATVRLVQTVGRAVSPTSRQTTTDTNGEYVLEALDPGDESVEVSHPKYLRAQKNVALKGRETRLDVQLEQGLRVSGVVVTEGGAPVAEATVFARGGHARQGASSRADGSFELESVAPGRYTITAAKSGYADGRVDDYDASSGAPVRIVLRTGGTIFGHVSGLTDDEIQNATVSARGSKSNASAAVDSSGNYRIEGVEVGTVRVSAMTGGRGMGGGRTSATRSVELASGGSMQVDLDFPTGTTVSGRVLRNGTPLGGAMVSFSPRTAASQTSANVSADDQGNYTVTGLEDGEYSVFVMDLQRFSPYSTAYEVRGSARFDIDFTTASVRGRVVDASNGETVADVNVQLRPADPSSSRVSLGAVSDSAGNFAVENVPPGSYSLGATREGYGGSPVDLQVGESGANGVELRLQKTDGVRLRIVDARDGRSVRAAVMVYDGQGRVVHDARMSLGTGGGDELNLPLPAGSFRATIWASGYAIRTISLHSPSTQTVPLSRGGTLVIASKQSTRRRARLVDASGSVYEMGLRLNGLFDLNPRPGLTTIENIAPGSYTLALMSEDETTVADTVTVVVQEGATASASI